MYGTLPQQFWARKESNKVERKSVIKRKKGKEKQIKMQGETGGKFKRIPPSGDSRSVYPEKTSQKQTSKFTP